MKSANQPSRIINTDIVILIHYNAEVMIVQKHLWASARIISEATLMQVNLPKYAPGAH